MARSFNVQAALFYCDNMQQIKNYILFFIMLFGVRNAVAQDPLFSQFFSSPFTINPSLAGHLYGDWRVLCNVRNQWSGPTDPYTTEVISFDTKLLSKHMSKNNVLGFGAMFINDQSLGGAFKSDYASLNFSYSITLDEEGQQHIGAGLGAIYGYRHVDFSRLTFPEQFASEGFNANLPTGETGLTNMKSYFSTTAGLLYSYTGDNTNFDIGIAGFHFNTPRQTFANNVNEYLSPRYVIHSNLESFLNDHLILNANAIYQTQASTNFWVVGGALGYIISTDADATIVNAGLWYRGNDAIIPYLGLSHQALQFGITYDVTTSALNDAAISPKTWELFFIIRSPNKANHTIPCPWK